MWWKFKRHRLALSSRHLPRRALRLDLHLRVPGALQSAHAQCRVHLRAAAGRAPLPRGRFVGPFIYGRTYAPRHGDAEARVHREPRRRAADALLLPRRPLRVLGALRGRLPFRLPGRRRPDVPARHGPARPRRAVAHRLRHAHLAHHRAHRRHRQLRARHRHRRAGRLSRRPARPRRAAHHRGAAVDPAASRCGWRWRRSCR